MKTVTIHNDFHNTKVTMRCQDDGEVSRPQVKKIWQTLCGIPECTCGRAGIRDHRIAIYLWKDGRGTLWGWEETPINSLHTHPSGLYGRMRRRDEGISVYDKGL